MTRDGASWLVAGQSLAGVAHTRRLLLYAEVLAGPFVLLAMFLGCLAVGQRALAPVEQSRRRQLEFTADASHELRTPLSVIRAEIDLASTGLCIFRQSKIFALTRGTRSSLGRPHLTVTAS